MFSHLEKVEDAGDGSPERETGVEGGATTGFVRSLTVEGRIMELSRVFQSDMIQS